MTGEATPGVLLVASTELSDGVFDQTVVLVLDADESGSLGVVLNREATIDLRSESEGHDGR